MRSGPSHLAGPVLAVLLLSAIAIVAAVAASRARRRGDEWSGTVVAASAAACGLLAIGAILLGAAVLALPFLVLVAAALTWRRDPRAVGIDLGLAGGLIALALLAGELAIRGLERFGNLPGGLAATASFYIGFATALAPGDGVVASALGRRRPLARGLATAYGGMGRGGRQSDSCCSCSLTTPTAAT